jgi:hypothetical protein
MSYAIIRTGGKQFAVESGQTLRVPSIDKKEGEKVEIEALSSGEGANMTFGAATLTRRFSDTDAATKLSFSRKNDANNTNVNKVTDKVIRKLKLISEVKDSEFGIQDSKLFLAV